MPRMLCMLPGRRLLCAACALAGVLSPCLVAQRPPGTTSAARTLLLPQRIVSGERATLAVLDAGGRLVPGASVAFSNGDHVKTDGTGRALFVAPLSPGVIFGSIEKRSGRVTTVILTAEEASASAIEISSTPRAAILTDRFEILGKGFCGDADANRVTIVGQPAVVLASSPAALVVLPPDELSPGPAAVEISCAKRQAPAFSITFVELTLKADTSPLRPGERRTLTVHVRGATEKVSLEARNLAPKVAELAGGNPVERASSGGPENVARFEVIGQKSGNFLISIRLVPSLEAPK
jgi:hypothetical protein